MSTRAKRSLWVFLLAAILISAGWLSAQNPAPGGSGAVAAAPSPPATRTDNVKETLHGAELVDPYRWLEDQWSPETRSWIEAQNKYTDSVIGHLPGREGLEKRLTELLRVESIGAP
ncbi:MAG TPA: hypothetical protein VLB32_07645, partial [Candidatus Acidoferrales bacterium]|nr:hypothetical protein [Candidatus Acidoferrales bacterium]